MVEAGADEVPEDVLLEALEIAHSEIKRICEAQEDLQRQAGKAKWLDNDLTAELESSHGHTIWERIQSDGLREASTVVDELLVQLAGEITMESTEEDIQRQMQVRSSLNQLLEKQRLVAVEGPVREQFESDLRALTDAEQDSKELKSAKRHLLFETILNSVQLPFPVGPATVGRRGGVVEGQHHEELRQEGRRGDLQGPRPQEDRGRQAAPGRARHRGDPPHRGRGRRQPPCTRLRPVHARPDAGALDAHARHREGRSADRRPVARDRPPLHAPLQLPAVLGRGDGLHARPEAA